MSYRYSTLKSYSNSFKKPDLANPFNNNHQDPKRCNSLTEVIRKQTTPLPGSLPYENQRQIRVKQKYDNYDLKSFLIARFPQISFDYWQMAINAGKLLLKGRSMADSEIVRAGNILVHLIPNTTEPNVDNTIQIIYEDENIIAINKPAPLPVHPSGRFNKNTLISFLSAAQSTIKFRIVHRLDSETTGILVLAKTKDAARHLRNQFDNHEVSKVYFALICPIPGEKNFSCSSAISPEPSVAGSRIVDATALYAHTDFNVIHKFPNDTALIKIFPRTGRTNQIRVHLKHLGYPIVGDQIYPPKGFSPNAYSPKKERLYLHSSSIRFIHPGTKASTQLFAPNPKWLQTF